MLRLSYASVVATLLLPALTAQRPMQLHELPDLRTASSKARQFQNLKVDGTRNAAAVKKLRKELRWHKSAATASHSASQKGRPIVLIQALGDLKGFC